MIRTQYKIRNFAAFAALPLIAFAGTYIRLCPSNISPLQVKRVEVATNTAVEPSPFVTEAFREQISQAYGRLPLAFEANRGQTAQSVNFLHRGSGYTLFLTSSEAVFNFAADQKEPTGGRTSEPENRKRILAQPRASEAQRETSVLRMKLLGANRNPQALGLEELPGKSNYFIGSDRSKWRTNVPTYAKVKFENCYPGVDLVYYGNQQQLEYDLVVAPGADPKAIRLSFDGAERMTVDEQGDLVLRIVGGDVQLRRPFIYQESAEGDREEIAGGYVLNGNTQVSFKVADYDRTRPLVIDPVLEYSTYLGGAGSDVGQSIAVDASGNAYVTGYTLFSNDFPTTSGASDTTANGLQDLFVSKLNADGSALVYSTYLGGNNTDQGSGIALDSFGNAYVTGRTLSSDFPTTSGAFDTTYNGPYGYDVFVTKLNDSGSALVYSTYLGGSANDEGAGIAVDAGGNAHVMGYCRSSNFPTTSGAFDTTLNADNNFVTKLNAEGTALAYSTHLGATAPVTNYTFSDKPGGIAIDSSGNIYITSLTYTTAFPTTAGAFDTTINGIGTFDAFVAKLNPAGGGTSDLVYCTYLGGGAWERGIGIAVDVAGNAYVMGDTGSVDFPTTSNAFDNSYNGGKDVFVTKVNADGSGLVYSTYLGGGGSEGSSYDGYYDMESGGGIAVDAVGHAYVTGYTNSDDFPTTSSAFDRTFNFGNGDVFVARLNADGSELIHSTYIGRSGFDAGSGIALDGDGNAYVTGHTTSAFFPTTSGAFDTTYNVGYDAFVVKLNPVGSTNQPPVATDDFYGVNQASSLSVPGPGVLANDSDPDEDPLTATLVTGPANAVSFEFNADGSFTYTPTAYFTGEDSFTYKANDGTEDSEIVTVYITVSQPGSQGFITGGGKFFQNNSKCTFGFVAKVQGSGVQGSLEFQDHDANIDVKSQSVDWVYAPDQVNGSFSGTCTLNGITGYTFFVQVHDLGQPGSNDDFTIWVFDPFNSLVYTASATLIGGNIVIHGN